MNFQKYPEYSSCIGKKKYDSVIDASDAGKMQMFNNGFKMELYMYQCGYCEKYHLTQQITDNKCLK
jgi:hypothetical protein